MSTAPRLIGFMPWLQLDRQTGVGGFSFVPFRDSSGTVNSSLAGLSAAFPAILSSYYDAQERPRENCVLVIDQLAQYPDEAWNLSETRIEAARWASSLLFLASWAANEYFAPVGSYVNDTSFQLFFQRFTEPVDFVSLSYRRRDGRILYGGPRHGEIHFTMPLHASSSRFHVETDFLGGLSAADVAASPVMESLRAVLPLVRLANTDNDVMTLDSEAALMGFALEQYFQADDARNLAGRFDELFSVYGKTTARTAQAQRPGIYPNPDPRFTEAQLSWFVAKIWMQELHQYRSAVAHGGSLSGRTWGWSPLEHLVMAAFVFPLAVKLGLAQEGHYSLSREDEIRCRAIDALLSQTDWAHENGSSMNTKWQGIIREQKRDVRITAAIRKAMVDLNAKGIVNQVETET